MRALREEKIADLESIILSMIDHYEPLQSHEDEQDRGSEIGDSLMRCIDFGDESSTGTGADDLDDLLLLGINSNGQPNDSCEDEIAATTTNASHDSLAKEIQVTCDSNNGNSIESTNFLPILPKMTTMATTRQGLGDFKTEKSTTSGSGVQRPRRFLVIEMDSGGRLYSCSECPLGFLEAGDLEAHLVACHPELERRHVCRECGKAFAAPRHLWKHRREVHRLVDRHHRCEQCQRGFKLADKLRRHRATVHGLAAAGDEHNNNNNNNNSLKYQCDECGKCFNRRDNLTQHRAYRHAGKFRTFECRRCGKKFGKMGSLKRHGADCSRDEKLYLYNAGLQIVQQQRQQQCTEAAVVVA